MTLTVERLKQVVHYDAETGLFRWATPRKKCIVGAVAGSIRPDGYVSIRIDWKRYYAHRLAWLYMTGSWPDEALDHRDCNPTNNSWRNLRLANPVQNTQNRRCQKNNRSGLKGVHSPSSPRQRRFYASISVEGKFVYLGSFFTPEDASRAYAAAARKYFGEFARAA